MYRTRFQTASRIWLFDEHRVVRVGSAPDSVIVLDEPGICALHAALRPTDAGWELHNSANGSRTWVNGERVEDTTRLGPSTEMRFGAQDDGVDAVIAIEEPSAKSAGWTKTPSQDCTGNSKPELHQTSEAGAQGDV